MAAKKILCGGRPYTQFSSSFSLQLKRERRRELSVGLLSSATFWQPWTFHMCYRTQASTNKPGHMSHEDQDAKHVVEDVVEEEDEFHYVPEAYATQVHRDALDLHDNCKTPKERRDLIVSYYSVGVVSRTEEWRRDEIRRYFEMWGYGDEEAEEESTYENQECEDQHDDDDDHWNGVPGGGESQPLFYESESQQSNHDLQC
jgi:hypothetical protein